MHLPAERDDDTRAARHESYFARFLSRFRPEIMCHFAFLFRILPFLHGKMSL